MLDTWVIARDLSTSGNEHPIVGTNVSQETTSLLLLPIPRKRGNGRILQARISIFSINHGPLIRQVGK
jgi:hypothetical protein